MPGFIGKVTSHGPGMYVRVPENNVRFSNLQDKELLHLEITNKDEESLEASRKVQKTGNQCEIYLPKNIKQELDLEHGDRISVIYKKD